MRWKTNRLPWQESQVRSTNWTWATSRSMAGVMVRRGVRIAFELFLYLAHQFLESSGEPVLANHKTRQLHHTERKRRWSVATAFESRRCTRL